MTNKLHNSITRTSRYETYPSGVDYSYLYRKLRKEYQRDGQAIEVNFRDIVPFYSGIDRYSHLIHSYPAKLILSIPYFFLNCSDLVKKNSVVLDPFCGSGTVLLESIVSGCQAIGADSNPLARLISKVKTTPVEVSKLETALDTVLVKLHTAENRNISALPQNILKWEYWFSERVKKQLVELLASIENIDDIDVKDFLRICFSNCLKKVSYADPNISVPVKLKLEKYEIDNSRYFKIKKNLDSIENADVYATFKEITKKNISRIGLLANDIVQPITVMIKNDARNLENIKSDSVDLIISSPPYAGAQKYIRSSSLELGWLSLCPNENLRSLEKLNIGREHYNKSEYIQAPSVPDNSAQELLKKIWTINPLRAHIAGNYLLEMSCVISECKRVLKQGSYMVLVMGNNQVCGYDFNTSKYIAEICSNEGFAMDLVLRDDINSRGLMTKRNKTASVITCEWIMVFRKK